MKIVKIVFILVNNVLLTEMSHSGAFLMGLHCLPKDQLPSFQDERAYQFSNSLGKITVLVHVYKSCSLTCVTDHWLCSRFNGKCST